MKYAQQNVDELAGEVGKYRDPQLTERGKGDLAAWARTLRDMCYGSYNAVFINSVLSRFATAETAADVLGSLLCEPGKKCEQFVPAAVHSMVSLQSALTVSVDKVSEWAGEVGRGTRSG